MLDTKLKKTRKFSWIAICLSVLLPAVFLVSLYPKMSEIVTAQQEEFKSMQENAPEEVFVLRSNFINYAVETSYYLYGRILQEVTGENVDFRVLEEYGWVKDAYYFTEHHAYYIEYGQEDVISKYNQEDFSGFLKLENREENVETYTEKGMIAYLILEYDRFGNVANINHWCKYEVDSGNGIYSEVSESIEKYQRNAAYFNSVNPVVDNTYQVEPKDFRCVFVLYEDSPFVYDLHNMEGYLDYLDIYLEMGAIWIVVILAVLVAILALVLPFIKPIGTGWEKLFCIPMEGIFVVAAGAVAGIVGMFYVMCHSNLNFLTEHFYTNETVEFMGEPVAIETFFGLLMVASVIAWSLCFLMEYMVAASFRQFCCNPKQYIKERILVVVMVRWIGKKGKQFYCYVTNIDVSEKLQESIVKLVLANFVILTLLCCCWFAGIIGVILYSIGLYVLLRKHGSKLQGQYKSVIHVAHQMAKGNLKVTLDEDLGILQPLGEELQKVQQGFSKAVVEEAKSQNMKTELITNISHDLKTPLTAIITYVDLLKQEDISEEARNSYIQTIEQKSNRLKVLIEDLFEVSKANSGNIKLNLQQVDVVSLLKQIRFEMEEEIQKSNLTFRWNLPEEKIFLELDSQRTYRIFENLLTNMLKYAMPYTRAYIDALILENRICIVFRNVSAAELDFEVERLSERFVRGDVSRNTQGNGLGLAIVKSFVEVQQGTFKIDVDGDLFKVTISWNIR